MQETHPMSATDQTNQLVEPSSSTHSSFVVRAGWLCAIGGIMGVVSGLITAFIPPALEPDRYSYPYSSTGFLIAQVVFIVNHLLLLAGIVGVARSGANGTTRSGRMGVWSAAIGMVALTLCEVRALTLVDEPYPSPSTETLDAFFGIATILIGVGLSLAGLAVLRIDAWKGWRRWVPLACGAATFLVVMPGLLISFLAGRLGITVWMLLFAALGIAVARDGAGVRQPHREIEAPSKQTFQKSSQ